MYDGTSMLPPKSGWNFSATRKPTDASMATRECFSSTSRRKRILPSDLSLVKPAGSKKPNGPAMPASDCANTSELNGGGASSSTGAAASIFSCEARSGTNGTCATGAKVVGASVASANMSLICGGTTHRRPSATKKAAGRGMTTR